MTRPHLATLLRTLEVHGVEHVLAGRTAARLHLNESRRAGSKESERPVDDGFVDLCFRQIWANCECLSRALEELDGRALPHSQVPMPLTGMLRGADRPLQVRWPGGTLNLLPHVRGLGGYEDLRPEAADLSVEGYAVRCLSTSQIFAWIEAACAATGEPIPEASEMLREASRRRAMRWLELADDAEGPPLEEEGIEEEHSRS